MIKKLLYLLAICLLPVCAFSQSPEDEIDPDNIDILYLEHLIKFKIDSVRESKGLHVLVNDSILYVAARHHSKQMAKLRELGHYENLPAYKTPQKCVDTYGAVNYFASENVAYIPVYKKLNLKQPELSEYITYGEFAGRLVKTWVKYRGYYKNIIRKECQITGVSIAYDPKSKRIYATQLLAEVKSKFIFTENVVMFPYEDPNEVEYELKELKQVAHKMHKGRHRWGLKPRKRMPGRCRECDAVASQHDKIGFYVDSAHFIHGVINQSRLFKKLTRRWRDGLAIEVVHYRDYECNNTNYFLKPSRRNGQCIANGTVEKPVYKWRLRRNYRIERFLWKRAKWSTIRNILLGFKFKYYKTAFKMIPTKFPGCHMDEVIGKFPVHDTDFFEINILFLKSKRVCSVLHYTDYCGQYFKDVRPTPLLPELSEHEYRYPEDTLHYDFSLYFKQGKSSYDYADIRPLLDTIKLENYTVVKLKINATASVEGSEEINRKLTLKRTMSIRRVLDSTRVDTLLKDIDTKEDWEHFYKQVAATKYAYLAKLDKEEVKKELENPQITKDLEAILNQERKAEIKLWLMLKVSDSTRLRKALEIYEELAKKAAKSKLTPLQAQKAYNVQALLYHAVMQHKIPVKILTETIFPNDLACAKLHTNGQIFQCQFDTGLAKQKDTKMLYALFKKQGLSPQATQVQRYNFLSLLINNWDSLHYTDTDAVVNPRKLFGYLGRLHGTAIPADTLSQLKLNFYFKAADWFYTKDVNETDGFLMMALNNIYYHYKLRNDKDSVAYKIARYFIYYGKDKLAYRMLVPFAMMPEPNHELFALYLKMGYLQDMYRKRSKVYKLMKKAPSILSKEEYCGLFTGPCNIGFQIFDNEEIRTQWCETCTGFSNYATWYRDQMRKKKKR